MSCWQTIQDYGLRSIGIGERILPKSDITLCEQVVLIGSGMLWNIYFAIMSLLVGFFLSCFFALGKNSVHAWWRLPSEAFVFVFRGSPLFVQLFFAYYGFIELKKLGLLTWLTAAQAGALLVLICNTSAYTAEIFYGAMRTLPKGDLDAADAFGFTRWKRFTRIEWPSMLRLSWPAYTNEAIIISHATVAVFFSGFPAIQQRGDALYYAKYFAEKTFNPFISYPIVAAYFVIFSLFIMGLFGWYNRRLNRHLTTNDQPIKRPRFLLLR